MLGGWTSLLVAFGGGALGAAFGGLPAFIFTGVMVIVGVGIAAAGGGRAFLTDVAFGPAFGPHVFFAGGAAAAAYAFWRGYVENGRDLARLLMGLGKPDVLAAGGIFGVFGFAANAAQQSFGIGPWTDTIAMTVVLSGIAARFAFGSTGLFGKVHNPDGRRFRPDQQANWLPWQQSPLQLTAIGFGMGILSAYLAGMLGEDGGGVVLGFGVAAALLVFLEFGLKAPVTHHIALPAALAMTLSSNLLFAAVIGVLAALAGEFFSRLFLIHGDTYIDPPAAAIATMTVLLRVADAARIMALIAQP